MKTDASAITHRRVWAISFPLIFSNVTQPLLGLADTAVIGRLDDEVYLGAIALGATIFSFLYWGFGFLRMGTTGFIAQAHGNGDQAELKATMARALMLASGLGIVTICLQIPISELAFWLIPGSETVESLAYKYYWVRVWSAPMVLINYACLGYFIGMGQTRTALAVQSLLYGMNIILDVLFVMGFGWDVKGVALGTALSETTAALVGLFIIRRRLLRHQVKISWLQIIDRQRFVTMMSVNSDIMVRTLAMLFCFSFFTAQGAKHGDLILAANAILMQLFYFMGYALDGFAQAAEVLVGNAVGRKNRTELKRAVIISTQWAAGVAILFSASYSLLGPIFIDLLTTLDDVRAAANTYLIWLSLVPVIAVWCFQYDGIFIGATETRPMRNGMLVTLIGYLIAWYALQSFGNHGLWAALLIFFALRGVTLAVAYPGLIRNRTDKPHTAT